MVIDPDLFNTKAILTWLTGVGSAGLFGFMARMWLRTLSARTDAVTTRDKGEVRVHEGYETLLDRQDKLIGQLERDLRAATEAIKDIRRKCTEENERLQGQIEELRGAVAHLEEQSLEKDRKIEELQRAIGVQGE